mgnify:CR=1 FL=1
MQKKIAYVVVSCRDIKAVMQAISEDISAKIISKLKGDINAVIGFMTISFRNYRHGADGFLSIVECHSELNAHSNAFYVLSDSVDLISRIIEKAWCVPDQAEKDTFVLYQTNKNDSHSVATSDEFNEILKEKCISRWRYIPRPIPSRDKSILMMMEMSITGR